MGLGVQESKQKSQKFFLGNVSIEQLVAHSTADPGFSSLNPSMATSAEIDQHKFLRSFFLFKKGSYQLLVKVCA